jgi:hypothetical protein
MLRLCHSCYFMALETTREVRPYRNNDRIRNATSFSSALFANVRPTAVRPIAGLSIGRLLPATG